MHVHPVEDCQGEFDLDIANRDLAVLEDAHKTSHLQQHRVIFFFVLISCVLDHAWNGLFNIPCLVQVRSVVCVQHIQVVVIFPDDTAQLLALLFRVWARL